VFIKSKPNIKENEIQTPKSNYLLLMFACVRQVVEKKTTQNKRSAFFGSVAGEVTVCSGTVAADEVFPILNFLCGFYKGDGGDSLYGDDVSKHYLWQDLS
jgi:hypothetical protein